MLLGHDGVVAETLRQLTLLGEKTHDFATPEGVLQRAKS